MAFGEVDDALYGAFIGGLPSFFVTSGWVLGWGYAVRLARDVGARDIRGKGRGLGRVLLPGRPVLTERSYQIPAFPPEGGAAERLTDPKAVPAGAVALDPGLRRNDGSGGEAALESCPNRQYCGQLR